jgi:uncharacterized protein YndB with AHSA1/START domain
MSAPRRVIFERDLPYPPEKVWRALTLPHLIEEWLMKNEFEPSLGHRFTMSAEWGTVECVVLKVEPAKTLVYSWGDHDMETTVTWTLTPTENGTHLKMEQAGFRADQPRYYGGAKMGWPRFLAALEELLARME